MTKFLFTNFGEALLDEAVLADDGLLVIDPLQALEFPSPGEGEAFALILWDGVEPQEIVYCTQNSYDGFLTVSRGEEGTTPRGWFAGTQLRNFLTAGTIPELLQTGFIEGNSATEAQARAGVSGLVLITPESSEYFFDERTTEVSRGLLVQTSVEAMRSYLGWQTATFAGTGLQTDFTLPDASWDTDYTRVYVDEIYQTAGYAIDGDQLVFGSPPASGSEIVVVFGQNFAFSVSFPGNNTVSTDALFDLAVTSAKLASNAVTTAKIAAKAVTIAKFQDISSGVVLGRTSAGSGSAQLIPLTMAGLGFTEFGHQTGDLKIAMRNSIPTGFIRLEGRTIGNASSGASERANADCEALFILWWNDFSNTILPIYTSSGAVSSRGSSAAADFAANKRLAVFDTRDEFFRFMGSGRDLGSTQAQLVGTHGHSASGSFSGNSLPGHSHSLNLFKRFGMNSDAAASADPGWSSGDSDNGSQIKTVTSVSAGTPSGSVSVSVSNHVGSENRPRNIALRVFAKL